MPKPIQVKIFMDTRPAALEEQVNAWLGQLGQGRGDPQRDGRRGDCGEAEYRRDDMVRASQVELNVSTRAKSTPKVNLA